MASWLADDSTKALCDAYKNADMHSGNKPTPQTATSFDPEGELTGKQECPIDWEAHRRFMRGM